MNLFEMAWDRIGPKLILERVMLNIVKKDYKVSSEKLMVKGKIYTREGICWRRWQSYGKRI